MIAYEEYIQACSIIEQYEIEQREEFRVVLSKSATTSIPEKDWGVHKTHCCFQHGCKYGDDQCPVEIGLIKQDYPCQDCDEFVYT